MSEENLIIRCGTCGTRNRIPTRRLNENPVCGKCRAPLSPGIHRAPVHVTDGDFEAQVLSEPGPVLLDCWAPWCGPCRSVAPILDELASAYAGRVKIAKLNVDENPVTASRFGIQSIPTMLFFKGGRLMQKLVGAVPRQEIEANLRAIM
ncbi:MAG: thioredoxin [Deltaproteobacteria bacterium]|nr:thioredoxin [Deltaproteobacteria bacterium]MBW1923184.1 thioredoxin [Deltaproteobacteria bacterium]MBW1948269.1 thioredoxin [Deltaproteobacteria bacterium]MBW2006766.1 thioredoxin [Deltaproteobacteria bacterium]MBW2101506.1 thioredoxin [Deltaproteobacteria bacterium]